jgi:prepilin peptidase CpaA
MRQVVLLLLLFIAAIMDLFYLKIKNGLILTGIAMGLYFSYFNNGRIGIQESLIGMMVPLAVLSIPYYFHMLGAADIKLFMVLGCFYGLSGTTECLLPIVISGGVLSIVKISYKKNLTKRLKYLKDYFESYALTRQVLPYYRGSMDKDAVIPLAIPIFLGVVISVFIKSIS